MVHLLVKKNSDIIKMHGTAIKNLFTVFIKYTNDKSCFNLTHFHVLFYLHLFL